jgi:transcription-repair coupling factor (superfamily II helicase)
MDEIERVDLYRRASAASSLVEVDDLAEELADRFGELPEPARNLLGLSRVKILAREIGASSVTYRSGALAVVGVTADPAAQMLVQERTGGVVGARVGRVTVRGSSLDALALAETALRALGRTPGRPV